MLSRGLYCQLVGRRAIEKTQYIRITNVIFKTLKPLKHYGTPSLLAHVSKAWVRSTRFFRVAGFVADIATASTSS
jgi:hypothetical protein